MSRKKKEQKRTNAAHAWKHSEREGAEKCSTCGTLRRVTFTRDKAPVRIELYADESAELEERVWSTFKFRCTGRANKR